MKKAEMVQKIEEGFRVVKSHVRDENALQDVVLSMLEKVHSKEYDPSSFEFETPENMDRYLAGATKKRILRIDQYSDNRLLSIEETTNDYGNIPEETHRQDDLFQDIIEAKQADGKPLFTKAEKTLISEYYIDELTQKELARKYNVSQPMIVKRLKSLNKKIGSLPVRDLRGKWYVGSQIDAYKYWEDTDILVDITGLKKYRRTQEEKDLVRFKENSEQARRKHAKLGASIDPIDKPVDSLNVAPIAHKINVARAQGITGKTDKAMPILGSWEVINSRSQAMTFNPSLVREYIDPQTRQDERSSVEGRNRANSEAIIRFYHNRSSWLTVATV